MSKIYEALRRHEKRDAGAERLATPSRGALARALEPIYPVIYRVAQEAGHGVVLHFVAASPGEGTSTLSGEFSRVAARLGDSGALLIDADRKQLSTAARFGCATDQGLIDHVQAGASIEAGLVEDRDGSGLEIGVLCGASTPPLSRKAVPPLYEQFRQKYGLTVVDCPAVFSDRYFELCPEAADGVVLIVEAERSRPQILRQARSLVENAGGQFIGSILNRRHTYIPEFLYRLL
jgi:Mrp family chromosome partitioning ATPase